MFEVHARKVQNREQTDANHDDIKWKQVKAKSMLPSY